MPDEVVQETSDRYITAYELLTGRAFTEFLEETGAS